MVLVASGCLSSPFSDEADRIVPDGDRPGVADYSLAIRDEATWQGMTDVAFRVAHDTDLNFTLANRPANPQPRSPLSGCGSVGFSLIREDSPVAGGRFGWAESAGHGAIVGLGDDATVVPLAGANENLFLRQNRTAQESVEANHGDILVLSLALWQSANEPFDPMIDVHASNATLEHLATRNQTFRCTANLADFSGYIAATGGAGQTTAWDASLGYATKHETTATFVVFLNPRFAGACDIEIRVDGTTVNESGLRQDLCGLSYAGPPGNVEFRINRLHGYGAAVSTYLWDGGATSRWYE